MLKRDHCSSSVVQDLSYPIIQHLEPLMWVLIIYVFPLPSKEEG